MRLSVKQLRSENGFSLLETLVALVVFSAISLAGAMVLRNYSDGQLALEDAGARLNAVQLTGTIMRDDLANAVMRPPRGTLGATNGVFFAGGVPGRRFVADEEPSLRLVRGAHPASQVNPSLPAVQTLEYWVREGALIRRSYARPDPTEETPINETVLLSGVENIGFRFRVDGSWVDEVQIAVGVRGRLPELVELRFTVPGRGEVVRTFAVGAVS